MHRNSWFYKVFYCVWDCSFNCKISDCHLPAELSLFDVICILTHAQMHHSFLDSLLRFHLLFYHFLPLFYHYLTTLQTFYHYFTTFLTTHWVLFTTCLSEPVRGSDPDPSLRWFSRFAGFAFGHISRVVKFTTFYHFFTTFLPLRGFWDFTTFYHFRPEM